MVAKLTIRIENSKSNCGIITPCFLFSLSQNFAFSILIAVFAKNKANCRISGATIE